MSLLPDALDQYRRDRTFEIAEVSEQQRERLLDVLGRQGAQAADLARSASHIASSSQDIAYATRDIAVEVSRMAAVADVALPAIVEHLAWAAERLGGVEQMLARPEETAAAEFLSERHLCAGQRLVGGGRDGPGRGGTAVPV